MREPSMEYLLNCMALQPRVATPFTQRYPASCSPRQQLMYSAGRCIPGTFCSEQAREDARGRAILCLSVSDTMVP